MKGEKRLFGVEFVIAGTRQLRRGEVFAKSISVVKHIVCSQFGHCDYFKIIEL
jgi:hypothetical protein